MGGAYGRIAHCPAFRTPTGPYEWWWGFGCGYVWAAEAADRLMVLGGTREQVRVRNARTATAPAPGGDGSGGRQRDKDANSCEARDPGRARGIRWARTAVQVVI